MNASTNFSDLTLARRLERAEGYACTQFAAARARMDPKSGSAWTEYAGTLLAFDGVEAPTTQSFGLGLFADLTPAILDETEAFFFSRGAAAVHEVCPLAGAAALQLLCSRGYSPIEVSNVLDRAVTEPEARIPGHIQVRVIEQDEAALWSSVNARGWAHEHPELEEFIRGMGTLCVARGHSPCFLAEIDGEPAAAGALVLHEGVALFGGAATVPERRRRGLQAALLEARLRYAHQHGCDLAMMVAEAGSPSQRNAERQGFRVAYTRIKWRREAEASTQ